MPRKPNKPPRKRKPDAYNVAGLKKIIEHITHNRETDQRTIAKKLGVAQQSISKWQNPDQAPDYLRDQYFVLLCALSGLPPHRVAGYLYPQIELKMVSTTDISRDRVIDNIIDQLKKLKAIRDDIDPRNLNY